MRAGATILGLVCSAAALGAPPRAVPSRAATPAYRGKYARPAEVFLRTLTRPHLLRARVPESGAMRRQGIQLRASPEQPAVKAVDSVGGRMFVRLARAAGVDRAALRLGDRRYVELTNATALATRDGRGRAREFLLARAVMPYETRVDLGTGAIETSQYYGDVVLFERGGRGRAGPRWRARDVLLRSDPGRGVAIEDPRMFETYVGGRRRVFLGFSEVAPHLPGETQPDVMNRYVELRFDRAGRPLPPEVDPASGRPVALDFSPPPVRGGGTTPPLVVTAKNGMFYENELGQIVMRARFMLDFDHPTVRRLARGQRWKYAEQVFVFRSLAELQAYDWRYALEDLFAPGPNGRGPRDRVRPLTSKVLLTDQQLRENFDPARVIASQGKGLGPGTMPVRLRRAGDEVFISEARGAEEVLVGRVPPGPFALADGEVKYLTFDHEMRFFGDRGFRKRHYSTSIKLLDATLTRIDAYFADAIQPTSRYQRGRLSGIVDLHHVYPVGRTIHRGRDGVTLRVYAGASDAHTVQYDFDAMRLLAELGPGSSRWQSGQVYRPGP